MRSKQIRVINGPRNNRSTTVNIYMSMVTSILSLVQNNHPSISSLVPKWMTVSKMGEDLKNGRQPQKWKMTSKMEDYLKNGRQPQKWKMTSKMEDDLKFGR